MNLGSDIEERLALMAEDTGEELQTKRLCPTCSAVWQIDTLGMNKLEAKARAGMTAEQWEEYLTILEPCPKCQEKQDKLHARNRWQRAMTQAGYPVRHCETVDTYAGEAIDKAKILKPILDGGGVCVLYGDRGRGKTGIAVWLAWQRALHSQSPGHFLRAMQIFLRVRATFRKDAPETEEDIVLDLQTTPLLVIDELHERSESDWENRVLTEVMNGRYESRKPTILIANADREKLTGLTSSC